MSYINSIIGQISANGQSVLLPVGELSGIGVDVRGTFVGTITFETSINGENWSTLAMIPAGATTNVAAVTTATAPGTWIGSLAGFSQFRARFSAYTSGMATITIRAEEAPSVIYNFSNGATSQTVTSTPPSGTNYGLVTAASTNAANIKSTAGSLFELSIFNVTAATIYVKLYNKATAPTVGTDVPIYTIPVAAGISLNLSYGQIGKRFAAGIGIAVTANAAATDATAVAAGAQISGTYI